MTREEVFERSLDAAMIVAIGKLVVFSAMWEELRPKLAKKGLSVRDTETFRRQLKQVIDDLDDEMFFIGPDQATSADRVKEIMTARVKADRFVDMVVRRLKSGQSDLAEYFP